MRGQETDHDISGPMRGLKKLHLMAQTKRQTDRQTSGHRNSMTDPAQRVNLRAHYNSQFCVSFLFCIKLEPPRRIHTCLNVAFFYLKVVTIYIAGLVNKT